MTEKDTRHKILDTAERLFAAEGFHRTSMRTLTQEAGVNLAAVNYHFGSKAALIEEVISRRLIPLNASRREQLIAVRDQAEAEGRPPEIREVLKAFIGPTLSFSKSGQGARDFLTIVGRALVEPDGAVRTLFFKHIQPVTGLFFTCLKLARPDMPENLIYQRMLFTLFATANLIQIQPGCVPVPAHIRLEGDTEQLTEKFLTYVTAGFEAPYA